MGKTDDYKLEIVIQDVVYDQEGKLSSATVLAPRSYIESKIVKAIDNEINKQSDRPPIGLLNEMRTGHGSKS
ncbi:hypothetical protein LIZ91_03050 [Enterococcus avium]|uniref:hypothetical protein n=1 Tax=Enterococcus avium TaxID=33945 RepID=UPI001D0761B8|nr:hypothetical protein [Enterococcus avium]MCB6915555.1 hypothetical protein [Enterococcus avium]MCQ4959589.1 hypothetical protein [Enterococcus avium]